MKPDNDISEYQTADWPSLENMTTKGCPCCGEPFNVGMRPELTGKCHQGAVYVSYWDSYLYVDCGECRKPICRVSVDRRLI